MNVRQLECFRAVMVTGTMTRAAAILGISQPAVSNLIAGLEHEIGFALFKRRKGRLSPTPEASYLYDEVERTLGSFDRFTQTARQIRTRSVGSLVIASYPGIAINFLPMVASEFMAGRPNVRVRLLSRSSHVVRELIPAQQFDIGIAELPIDHPGVTTEPFTFECLCALPSGHALTARDVITPEDLDGVPFAALFREHMTYFQLARLFAEHKARWNVVAETQFFASCCAFAAFGACAAIVDPYTADFYASARGVALRRFDPPVIYEIGLLTPVGRVRSRLADAFIDVLKEKIGPYLRPASA